ncbi:MULTISPECIES: hypothetical protein [unclassified Streptomyces]|uniref:hypothetical protein n=1 Tax=unclassified Streptomyces TaxID=2593676 RepID=UPI0036C7D947
MRGTDEAVQLDLVDTGQRNSIPRLGPTLPVLQSGEALRHTGPRRDPISFEGQILTGAGIRADSSTFSHVRKAAERITAARTVGHECPDRTVLMG